MPKKIASSTAGRAKPKPVTMSKPVTKRAV
ncbi:MAG: hypothetical protein QOK03_1593, partial [Candidatus Binataceae bacterium]|nr:hypothetical protein [Candidatus Binataceae bacterium]